MLQIYVDAKALGYNPTYFIKMVNEMGGYAAAKQLIADTKPADGFVRLWELRRLDISVEARALPDALVSDGIAVVIGMPGERAHLEERIAGGGQHREDEDHDDDEIDGVHSDPPFDTNRRTRGARLHPE